ncbi:adhesin [Novilysobacter spongiicola]|uniref:Adhesin n=1 Tax=Lysobacter spongiicola DSM 21749 TaxID=1122188 RepID=A0A1T4Q181_9GAMM|nr:adhesin [Lysobacter spongiicola]SJZ97565.1 hypothetical protein SAMN02745674_01437 [Lysobacter spongiicola DSM 21749]
MNSTIRKTGLALAVAALAASPAAFAQDDQNASANIDHQHVVNEDWDIDVDDTRDYILNNDTTNTTTTNTYNNTVNNLTNNTANNTVDTNVDLSLDAAARLRLNAAANIQFDGDYDETISSTESYRYSENVVFEDIQRTENVQSDIRREGNEHQVSVSLEKDLSLSSDINFSGDPTISGDIAIDSAAIAVVDNRQSVTGNVGYNDMLDNDASIADDAAEGAAGNLAFNVAAGDNNVQDNAVALSAADASFAFGMADAEVFVNQVGSGNGTINMGVANDASIGGNAFANAAGNLGVNVASGNNNSQKNAMAASVATAAYAQSSVSSNQMSSGNVTSNEGSFTTVQDSIAINLGGTVSGSADGTYEGSGASYQQSNFYPDYWEGNTHPDGTQLGHIDYDNDAQGAVENPNRDGVGGFAFDNEESGVIALDDMALDASLSGTLDFSYQVAVAATNSATLDGSAFQGASGNIGVNIASGTGNMQANSLAMAVAQPSTGGGGGGGEQ